MQPLGGKIISKKNHHHYNHICNLFPNAVLQIKLQLYNKISITSNSWMPSCYNQLYWFSLPNLPNTLKAVFSLKFLIPYNVNMNVQWLLHFCWSSNCINNPIAPFRPSRSLSPKSSDPRLIMISTSRQCLHFCHLRSSEHLLIPG